MKRKKHYKASENVLKNVLVCAYRVDAIEIQAMFLVVLGQEAIKEDKAVL